MVTPREARPTLRFVDEYGQLYADLFPEVRSYNVAEPFNRVCLEALAQEAIAEFEAGHRREILLQGTYQRRIASCLVILSKQPAS